MKLTARIYLAILASLTIFLVAVIALGLLLGSFEQRSFTKQVAADFSQKIAPRLDAQWLESRLAQVRRPIASRVLRSGIRPMGGPDQNMRTLFEFARNNYANIEIIAPSGEPIVQMDRDRFNPKQAPPSKGFAFQFTAQIPLENGFSANIRTHNPHIVVKSFAVRFALGLGVLFGCVGLIAYPLARRITGQLSNLTKSVDAWGSKGAVKLELESALTESRDEIGGLARSFKKAGERIESLIQANKLLLANASHEIRTPLTRIRLNLEMLNALIDETKQGDFAKREAAIKRNLTELDALIDNILQSSRIEAQAAPANARSVDLYSLLEAEAHHFEHINLTGTTAFVEGDENLLTQVIRNLINNAYKHGKPPVSADVSLAGEQVYLTILDAGGHIPESKLDVIFEPFQRLSSQKQGSGLGLHLVKQIVALHGGSIKVTSDENGTCFTVTFPKFNLHSN